MKRYTARAPAVWKVLRDIEPYLNGRGTYPKTSGEVNALFEKGAIDMHLSYDISESPARHSRCNPSHKRGGGRFRESGKSSTRTMYPTMHPHALN